MGDIADGILDGDFDEETGEYIGGGQGFPRSLERERRERENGSQNSEKDRAYLQCKNLILCWRVADNTNGAVAIIREYAISRGWTETNAGTIGKKLLNEVNGWKGFKDYLKTLPEILKADDTPENTAADDYLDYLDNRY